MLPIELSWLGWNKLVSFVDKSVKQFNDKNGRNVRPLKFETEKETIKNLLFQFCLHVVKPPAKTAPTLLWAQQLQPQVLQLVFTPSVNATRMFAG